MGEQETGEENTRDKSVSRPFYGKDQVRGVTSCEGCRIIRGESTPTRVEPDSP